MSTRNLLRWLGALMILDGVLSLVFGKSYLRLWRRSGEPIASLVSLFRHWPDWLVRVAGAGEAVVGLQALGASPFRVPDIYHTVARIYDPVRALWDTTFARGVEDAVNEAVTKYLPPGGKVLDLGCGTGVNIARLQRLGIPFSQYVGVDLTPEMLEMARQKFGHLPNVTFLQKDLLHDPLPDGEFDLVISTWVFSHLGERARAVVEKAQERLKPHGHVVLLMFSETGAWLDPIVDTLTQPFAARLVPKEIYLSFPGRVDLRRLAGGIATLVVLRK